MLLYPPDPTRITHNHLVTNVLSLHPGGWQGVLQPRDTAPSAKPSLRGPGLLLLLFSLVGLPKSISICDI